MKKQIKLYFINGYLGSGKTTLLNHLLSSSKDEKAGVLVNDFGSISIDGAILKEHQEFTVSELSNGSIFCSCLKGNFIMELARFSNLPIDMLFIESSGIADPSNVGMILNTVKKMIGNDYDYRGSICIIDAENFIDQYDTLIAIEKQVVYADVVIINKTDIVEEDNINEIEEIVQKLNPLVDIIRTSFSKIPNNLLKKDFRKTNTVEYTETSNTCSNRPPVFVLESEGVFIKEKLVEFLNSVSSSFYRIKGFINTEEKWKQVDVVGGRIDIKPTNIDDAKSKLVFIAREDEISADKITIEENWQKLFNNRIELISG